jgi:hypothetical protein
MSDGKIYAGASGWAYANRKPKFYPVKLGAKKFREHYATSLSSVEVNYRVRKTLIIYFTRNGCPRVLAGLALRADLPPGRHNNWKATSFQRD